MNGNEGLVAAELWERYTRVCERVAGCFPCPGTKYPGLGKALEDVAQLQRVIRGMWVEMRDLELQLWQEVHSAEGE